MLDKEETVENMKTQLKRELREEDWKQEALRCEIEALEERVGN